MNKQINPKLAISLLGLPMLSGLMACSTMAKQSAISPTKSTIAHNQSLNETDSGYQCDQFGALPSNPDNPVTVKGVVYADLNIEKAIEVCTQAVQDYPDVERYQFNLGRAYVHLDEDNSDKKAYDLLTPLADNDYAEAYTLLADIFESGSENFQQSYVESKRLFHKGAELGSSVSEYNIGADYYCGVDGTEQSYQQAKKWFLKSAEKGHPDAQYWLGVMYEQGNGVEVDYKQAFDWYMKSAKQGYTDSYFEVGYYYDYGQGVEQSYEKANHWYQKSAETGNTTAQYNLGVNYEYGQGVPQSYEKALQYYQQSAEGLDTDAMLKVGYFYEQGYGVEESEKKALEYYQSAVDSDESGYALNNIGVLYENGSTSAGLEQSYEKAMTYFQQSAKLGNELAMKNIGDLYESGLGVPQDDEKAEEWYQKATASGDDEMMFNIAQTYYADYDDNYLPDSQAKHMELANQWYQKSAELGNAQAMEQLAFMYGDDEYTNGVVKKSIETAIQWYQKAIEAGNQDTVYTLIKFYENEDKAKEAFQLLLKYAEQGDNRAMLLLGGYYQYGKGGAEQSYDKAVYWYQKAVDSGNKVAIYYLIEFYENQNKPEEAFQMLLQYAEKGQAIAMPLLGKYYEEGKGVEKSYEKALYWYQQANDVGIGLDLEPLKLKMAKE